MSSTTRRDIQALPFDVNIIKGMPITSYFPRKRPVNLAIRVVMVLTTRKMTLSCFINLDSGSVFPNKLLVNLSSFATLQARADQYAVTRHYLKHTWNMTR